MMTTDNLIIDRIRNQLTAKNVSWEEKKMFGGYCFMVDDKMCFGTYKGGIMARIDPEKIELLEQKHGAEQMIHGGRPMKGYLMLGPEAYDSEQDLDFWIQKCLDFNPKAKASKKKKK